jgi:hypothetical protein
MRYLITLVSILLLLPGAATAQKANLSRQLEQLTRDCKNIRGHAGRVVEEASQSELNKDLALAHAQEVVRNLELMERNLDATARLLTNEQHKLVRQEQESLEKTCERLKELSTRLRAALSKEKPDRLEVKKIAMELRNEMSAGNEVHQRMKKKLGMK